MIFNFGKITIGLMVANIFFYMLSGYIDISPFLMNRSFISQPWRLLTSMFLHANFVHLAYNMYALFIYGNILETHTSSKAMLKIVLLGGIIGNIGFAVFSSGNGLGFSGAIYALILAAAKRYPELKVLLPFGFIALPVKIKFAGPMMLVGELLLSILNPIDGIAHSAHLFGGLAGLLF